VGSDVEFDLNYALLRIVPFSSKKYGRKSEDYDFDVDFV
jgi:hypothetical protein